MPPYVELLTAVLTLAATAFGFWFSRRNRVGSEDLCCRMTLYNDDVHVSDREGTHLFSFSAKWAPGDPKKYVEFLADHNTAIARDRDSDPHWKEKLLSVQVKSTAEWDALTEDQKGNLVRAMTLARNGLLHRWDRTPTTAPISPLVNWRDWLDAGFFLPAEVRETFWYHMLEDRDAMRERGSRAWVINLAIGSQCLVLLARGAKDLALQFLGRRLPRQQ